MVAVIPLLQAADDKSAFGPLRHPIRMAPEGQAPQPTDELTLDLHHPVGRDLT